MTPKACAHRTPDTDHQPDSATKESFPASDPPCPTATTGTGAAETDPDRLRRRPCPSDMRLLRLWQPVMVTPKNYRVDFFNTFARGQKNYRVCQRSVVVRSVCCAEEAVRIAKARFAEIEGVPNWHIHAADIEVVPIGEDPGPCENEQKKTPETRW